MTEPQPQIVILADGVVGVESPDFLEAETIDHDGGTAEAAALDALIENPSGRMPIAGGLRDETSVADPALGRLRNAVTRGGGMKAELSRELLRHPVIIRIQERNPAGRADANPSISRGGGAGATLREETLSAGLDECPDGVDVFSGSVVDNHQLEPGCRLSDDTVNGPLKPGPAIECRDDHGDQGRWRRHRSESGSGFALVETTHLAFREGTLAMKLLKSLEEAIEIAVMARTAAIAGADANGRQIASPSIRACSAFHVPPRRR